MIYYDIIGKLPMYQSYADTDTHVRGHDKICKHGYGYGRGHGHDKILTCGHERAYDLELKIWTTTSWTVLAQSERS